jgi:hypothetical protein
LTLLLICMAVVPVVTLTVSQFAGILPAMLVRGMALAVIFTWIGFAIWPLPPMKAPDPPAPPSDFPVAAALVGTAIVMPLVLVYLLFGLTDAIPVLLTTVLIVAKMEVGLRHARANLLVEAASRTTTRSPSATKA